MTDEFTKERIATLRDQIGAADDPEFGLALLNAIERRDQRIAELRRAHVIAGIDLEMCGLCYCEWPKGKAEAHAATCIAAPEKP